MNYNQLNTYYPKVATQLFQYIRDPELYLYDFDDTISVEVFQVFNTAGVKVGEFYLDPKDNIKPKETVAHTYFMNNIVNDYNELNLWVDKVHHVYSTMKITNIDVEIITNNRLKIRLKLVNLTNPYRICQ
jgi:hypothetical protein